MCFGGVFVFCLFGGFFAFFFLFVFWTRKTFVALTRPRAPSPLGPVHLSARAGTHLSQSCMGVNKVHWSLQGCRWGWVSFRFMSRNTSPVLWFVVFSTVPSKKHLLFLRRFQCVSLPLPPWFLSHLWLGFPLQSMCLLLHKDSMMPSLHFGIWGKTLKTASKGGSISKYFHRRPSCYPRAQPVRCCAPGGPSPVPGGCT